jgi:hypothetical protein
MPHIFENVLTRATTLLYTSPQSEVFTQNYWPPKQEESQFWGFRDFQLGSPNTKWHLGVGPMARHKEYYKGEGGGFVTTSKPQTLNLKPPNPSCGEFCEFVFVRGLFVHQKCSNYVLTNLLFGLCRSMWIIDPLVTHLNAHLKSPTCPSTPKVLRAKERTPTPRPSIVFTLDS